MTFFTGVDGQNSLIIKKRLIINETMEYLNFDRPKILITIDVINYTLNLQLTNRTVRDMDCQRDFN